jgi:uracil-DNA glycosylase
MVKIMNELESLVAEIRACRICRDMPKGKPLPHEPRPVLQVSQTARILIAGQAPGKRVHASGRPFTDPSGDRLRDWLGIGVDIFYDAARIAILPMGFCFPGLDRNGGDLPPRRECALAWRSKVLALMPRIEVILAIGTYAQRFHLNARGNVRETVADWRQWASEAPKIYALPHPSWRNNAWLKNNAWFEREILPEIKHEIAVRL